MSQILKISVLVSATLFVAAGCSPQGNQKRKTQTAAPTPAKIQLPVEDLKLSQSDLEKSVREIGTLTAENASEATVTEKEKEIWPRLLEFIVDNGRHEDSPTGYYISLIHLTAKTEQEAHQAFYISVVGGMSQNNSFGISRVEFVHGDWKINKEGNKDGEQWMFLLNREGKLAKHWRYHFVKKMNDTVLVHDAMDATDAMALQKLESLKKFWYSEMEKKVKQ